MLKVHRIFRTIQGEGPFAGYTAVFIRLAGCNLNCSFCDTDFSLQKSLSVDEVVSEVDLLANHDIGRSNRTRTDLVVLTGGEPLIQDIAPLVEVLRQQRYSIQIETNGTVFPSDLCDVWSSVYYVCSPKGQSVHSELQSRVIAWKYVIRSGDLDEDDGLPVGIFRPYDRSSIYLQPMDEHDEQRNSQNLRAVVKSCMKHDYRLSLQIHKIIGVE